MAVEDEAKNEEPHENISLSLMPPPVKRQSSSLITDPLLDALAMQESQNDPEAVGDKGLRYPAYGAYQMRQPAFRDVQRLRPQTLPEDVTTASQLLGQPDLQRSVARAYLDILEQEYQMRTLEQLLGAYNAGVGRVKKGYLPTAYIEGVQSHLP